MIIRYTYGVCPANQHQEEPLRLFAVGSRSASINDLLPTTHTISGLGKVLNHEAGLGGVASEQGAMLS